MWLIKLLLSWRVRRWTRSLAVGGRKRTYHVHVPPQYHPQTPAPLVLALHGATMTGPLMAWFSGLDEKADEAGFLAVYPNGTGSRLSYSWNGGNCCGYAMQNQVDDVAFIRAVLDDLAQVVPGRCKAGLRHRHVERGDHGLPPRLANCPTASPPSPRCPARWGRRDASQSGPCRSSTSTAPTTSSSRSRAARAGRACPGRTSTPSITRSGPGSRRTAARRSRPRSNCPTRRKTARRSHSKTYGGGKDGAEVVLVVIEGGGHTWPGREPRLKVLGKATKNVSANDLMWEFFEKHPMK